MKNNENKLVVSVGAGYPQAPFIKALKKRGFKVAAFGKGRNDELAIKHCDYFKEIDTTDAGSVFKWIASLEEPVFACGSYAGGVAIDTLQELDRGFNTATQIPEKLSVGMDKVSQQNLYRSLDLSDIETLTVSTIKKTPELIKPDQEYILKPIIGRGSAGVHHLTGSEILDWVGSSKASNDDLVQEFISGEEYRLMAIVQNGQLKFLAQIKRDSLKNTFLLGRLSIVTSAENRLANYMNKLIQQTKISNSIIKLDVLVSDSEVNMIEMDIGVGGGIYFKDFIEHAYQYDIEENYIRLITGQELEPLSKEPLKNIKMDYIFNYQGETIEYNLDEIQLWLNDNVGKHKIVKNLLGNGEQGKFSSNAHFIFTVIHQNECISTIELNEQINNRFFKTK